MPRYKALLLAGVITPVFSAPVFAHAHRTLKPHLVDTGAACAISPFVIHRSDKMAAIARLGKNQALAAKSNDQTMATAGAMSGVTLNEGDSTPIWQKALAAVGAGLALGGVGGGGGGAAGATTGAVAAASYSQTSSNKGGNSGSPDSCCDSGDSKSSGTTATSSDFAMIPKSLNQGIYHDETSLLEDLSQGSLSRGHLFGDWGFSYQTKATPNGVLGMKTRFPFSKHEPHQSKDQFAAVSWNLNQQTWLAAGSSKHFSSTELGHKWSKHLRSALQFGNDRCSSQFVGINCQANSKTLSVGYQSADFELLGFSRITAKNLSTGALRSRANFQSYGLSASWLAQAHWRAGFSVQQRPELLDGQVTNLAFKTNTSTGHTQVATLSLTQNKAPMYFEFSLLNRINPNTALKYSLERNTNYDGYGHADTRGVVRYSKHF